MDVCEREVILAFDEPINQWVSIECKGGIEFLAPKENYVWLDVNGDEVLLFADLRQEKEVESKGRYFQSQVSKVINGYSTIRNFNEYLNDNVDGNFAFENIYYSRVLQKERQLHMNFIFMFMKTKTYLLI